jgi:hypothetical protein
MTPTHRFIPRLLILTALCLGLVACDSDPPDTYSSTGTPIPDWSAVGEEDESFTWVISCNLGPVCGDGDCWRGEGEDGVSCPEDCEGIPGVRCEGGTYDCLGACRTRDKADLQDPACNPAYDCREFDHDDQDCLRCETDADCNAEKHCGEYACDAACQIATCDQTTSACTFEDVPYGEQNEAACGQGDGWYCWAGDCQDRYGCGNGVCKAIIGGDHETCPRDCHPLTW